MISEFLELRDALKYASMAVEVLSPGYFVKVGKRLEVGRVVFWVMVPLERGVDDVRDKE